MIKIGRESESDISLATSHEWLITNGIGGYASSTVPCINTRRYHGILVASQRPPVDRIVMVSRLEETICLTDESIHSRHRYTKIPYISLRGIFILKDLNETPYPLGIIKFAM